MVGWPNVTIITLTPVHCITHTMLNHYRRYYHRLYNHRLLRTTDDACVRTHDAAQRAYINSAHGLEHSFNPSRR